MLVEGAVCRHIYFVEQGYLRTFHNRDGVEINLSFSFEGSFVTDLGSLRNATPSTVTIRAEEQSVVQAIAREDLIGLYAGSAEIEAFGRRLLEELLAEQEEQANLFRLHTPAERYHRVVTRNPQLLQRVSLSHLASWLGVTRETLSRIRSRG